MRESLHDEVISLVLCGLVVPQLVELVVVDVAVHGLLDFPRVEVVGANLLHRHLWENSSKHLVILLLQVYEGEDFVAYVRQSVSFGLGLRAFPRLSGNLVLFAVWFITAARLAL